MNSPTLSELSALKPYLTPQELEQLDKLLSTEIWVPLAGPQTEALNTEADILFYGGAAGGGKTDLLLGLALTRHLHSIIFRREGKQLQGIFQRMQELLMTRDGFNSQTQIWNLPGRIVEFGSCKDFGSEIAYQGRPHDFIGFDEITHFLEAQFRFLMGWLRTTRKGQRCRVVCAGNPPTDSDGDWVIQFWGPWLDENHPNPAKPGELRWYATLDGKDVEVENGEPFTHHGERIKPMSRTFIPSKIADNPYLLETGYMAQLQSLPEPLRSQMLNGDFTAGKDDDPWQVIPTHWVKMAMDRWEHRDVKGVMTGLGIDVARGGRDETVLSRRHGNWYDELIRQPGMATPDGPAVASLAVNYVRNGAPISVDVIGVGTSVYDHLKTTKMDVNAVNFAEKSIEKDKSGQLPFRNKRAEYWWRMREDLDPQNDKGIALPNDSRLKADLCAPRWKLVSGGIQIESKEEIIKRIGRSPDSGDAVVLARKDQVKRQWEPLKYKGGVL